MREREQTPHTRTLPSSRNDSQRATTQIQTAHRHDDLKHNVTPHRNQTTIVTPPPTFSLSLSCESIPCVCRFVKTLLAFVSSSEAFFVLLFSLIFIFSLSRKRLSRVWGKIDIMCFFLCKQQKHFYNGWWYAEWLCWVWGEHQKAEIKTREKKKK